MINGNLTDVSNLVDNVDMFMHPILCILDIKILNITDSK